MTMTGYLSVLVAFSVVAACESKPEATGSPMSSQPEDTSRSLDSACLAKYDARARALITRYGACEVDADCALAFSDCLSPLLCGTPTARASTSEFEAATATLIADYLAECGNFCSIADCEDPSGYHPTCDGATGLCAMTRNERDPGAQQQ